MINHALVLEGPFPILELPDPKTRTFLRCHQNSVAAQSQTSIVHKPNTGRNGENRNVLPIVVVLLKYLDSAISRLFTLFAPRTAITFTQGEKIFLAVTL